ncbi:hypothetical protein OUZ56_033220 [Daphnia magna]|uniref:Uncharacterized protein n=1 Tax=Daphnia magna TaxID=35525 RepID=A0ABR0BAG0_9CRUS|nr:hypothetical protein OUZ56_033220 [Daphnia magna]
MPINLSWRGDEILARGKNGREKQRGKKGGTEVPTTEASGAGEKYFANNQSYMFPVILKSSDKSDRVLFAKENLNVRSEVWLEAIACDELNLWLPKQKWMHN